MHHIVLVFAFCIHQFPFVLPIVLVLTFGFSLFEIKNKNKINKIK